MVRASFNVCGRCRKPTVVCGCAIPSPVMLYSDEGQYRRDVGVPHAPIHEHQWVPIALSPEIAKQTCSCGAVRVRGGGRVGWLLDEPAGVQRWTEWAPPSVWDTFCWFLRSIGVNRWA